MRHAAIALLLLAPPSPSASARQAAQGAEPRPTFEVAAIKRSANLDAGGTLAMQPGGRFRTINVDARNLIAFAYRTGPRSLVPSQIIGAPDWMATERYDITAKIGAALIERATTDPLQTPKLVQSLLEDRFKLRLHREVQNMPVYTLVVTRKNGTFGPRLRRSTVDCAKDRSKCRLQSAPGHLTGGSVTMETLSIMLSGPAGRMVLDRTGLTGAFDVELEWSGDQTDADKPSVFAAVQEQLGLKLEFVREPVDTVVIDHVERPTED